MMAKTNIEFKRLVSTRQLKQDLQFAAMYLVVYELLAGAIRDGVRSLFKKKIIRGVSYRRSVVVLHKDILTASAMWLCNLEAITKDDMKAFRAVRRHRNDIAHELLTYVSTDSHTIDSALFVRMCQLIYKIDKWMTELSFEYESRKRGEEVDFLITGRVLILSIIINSFHGTAFGKLLKRNLRKTKDVT
jgi:hypothetical protein